MKDTPRGMRPHIILLGRRNVGKSSLVNALCEQPLALVSAVPGTTTDPVHKPFELLPFGPVVFVDTGGVDDVGELGLMRVALTRRELSTADFALLVVEAGNWGAEEDALLADLKQRRLPHLVVVNKTDLAADWRCPEPDAFYVSARENRDIRPLRQRLSAALTALSQREPTIVGDLVTGGKLVVMVAPIDLEAPKGRLILPQVMTIRDVLDHDAVAMVVKERELHATLKTLGRDPDLVITDSQVVLKVAGDVPETIPLTTFSILFARLKGDLATFVRGAMAIDDLTDGDKVLIAEACSHHAVADDIGRVKIPRWVRQYTGMDLHFDVVQGMDFPDNLEDYRLVVHCGGCMLTPRAMQARMGESLGRQVPISNYGVTISHVQGVLKRVLVPFGGLDLLLGRP